MREWSDTMSTIGVVGAGTMGCGIAQVFLQKGFKVVLSDIEQTFVEKAVIRINKALERSIQKGDITADQKEEILSRLDAGTDIERFGSCDVVIEAVAEDINVKRQIFGKLDQVCRADCILATNTSSLSITEISLSTGRPEKVAGLHFFNPAPVMKLVEIVEGHFTSEETLQKIREIAETAGKIVVKVKEAPGFVVNRLLIPMINEAVVIYSENIASAEDIDNAMKFGANHPMGPLALADLIGIDVVLSIMEILHKELGEDKYRPAVLLKKMVRAGMLGKKTGQGFYRY